MRSDLSIRIGDSILGALGALQYLRVALADRPQCLPRDTTVDSLFAAAKSLKIAHVVRSAYSNVPAVVERTSPFAAYNEIAQCTFRRQLDAWKYIDDRLSGESIDSIVLKSIYNMLEVHSEDARYVAGDIDLIVRMHDIPRVREILIESGYSNQMAIQAGARITVPSDEIARSEASHFELCPYFKIIEIPELTRYAEFITDNLLRYPFLIEGGKVYYGIVFDIHHNIVREGVGVDDIWSASAWMNLAGRRARVLTPEYLMWFLPARLYLETMCFGKKNAKLLADIVSISRGREVCYQSVLDYGLKYHHQYSLLYVYHYLHRYARLEVPGVFLSQLQGNCTDGLSFRNWGDFIPRLLGQRCIFAEVSSQEYPR